MLGLACTNCFQSILHPHGELGIRVLLKTVFLKLGYAGRRGRNESGQTAECIFLSYYISISLLISPYDQTYSVSQNTIIKILAHNIY